MTSARAYLLKDWCVLGPRIVVHPLGLPPGWKESGLTIEEEQRAFKAKLWNLTHLDPTTFERLDTFELK